jgi:hypothetical protein
MSAFAPRFRVLILNTPTLLGDLLTDAMTRRLDFEVIHESEFARADGTGGAPDVVVLGRALPDQERAASTLLARWPQSLVVGIASDRRGATLYEFEPTKMAIGDLPPQDLVLAIKSTVARGRKFRARKPTKPTTRRR